MPGYLLKSFAIGANALRTLRLIFNHKGHKGVVKGAKII
ncbi:hypothetical protein Cabys_4151 [Caldithrix abyssi DSM 13497]|uniref:Uncharacterized protein n=1 Tax=Caldithrix abyssi DSM 13497 TaxID=880073 RepID=A0A1J1CG10_CALAY|nr:hypothetical protein Cabys_4151 [Caldithrix abyssi DSM 13497]